MKKVVVHDAFQKGYSYIRTKPVGKQYDPTFKPELTPPEMLRLGVFGGLYFGDRPKEFPRSWFVGAKLSKDARAHKELNYFGVIASQSLKEWQRKGWIHKDDPRGWFQWYCRYYLGRRHEDDARQIKRWNMMRRHVSQIFQHCSRGDFFCRRRQRQAVLHWAYDSRNL